MISITGAEKLVYKPDYSTAMQKAKAVIEEVESVGRDVIYLDNNLFSPGPDEYVTVKGQVFRPEHVLDADEEEGAVSFGTGKDEALYLNGNECKGAEGGLKYETKDREITSMCVAANFADADRKDTRRVWSKQISDSIERYTITDSLTGRESAVTLDKGTGTLRYSFDSI
ncbi:MAG: hypothetical protein AB9903_35410 [Vulcanimicrobiota bacterium]